VHKSLRKIFPSPRVCKLLAFASEVKPADKIAKMSVLNSSTLSAVFFTKKFLSGDWETSKTTTKALQELSKGFAFFPSLVKIQPMSLNNEAMTLAVLCTNSGLSHDNIVIKIRRPHKIAANNA